VCIYTLAYLPDVVATVQQRLATISEPNRFRIVELLKDGPQPVGGIVDELGLGQPQVSRHLRLLAEADVVEVTKRAQQRIYRLHPDAMHVISDWVNGFAVLWAERMDRLGSLLDDDRAPDEPNPGG
jgi:DNA-binding transcriptional ArsR family regulator